MKIEPLTITFPTSSSADGNRYASSLAETLRDLDPSIKVEQLRDRPDTQDFGATLVLVLGTASATAVAKGIAAWIARHGGARIEIKQDGSVVATGLDSQDAAKIAEAIQGSK